MLCDCGCLSRRQSQGGTVALRSIGSRFVPGGILDMQKQKGLKLFFNSNSTTNLFEWRRIQSSNRSDNHVCCRHGSEVSSLVGPLSALIYAWHRLSRANALNWRSCTSNSIQTKGLEYAGMTTYASHIKRPKKIKEGRTKKKVQPQYRKVTAFENIVDRDDEFRFLIKTKEWLSKEPEQVLQLDDAGKMYRELGFPRGRKVTRSIEKHPALFQLYRHTDGKMWLGFTDLMERLLKEEHKIMEETELSRMNTVRKLIMMSVNKRVTMAKFHHCRHIFGLPDNFRDRIKLYPQFFRVVEEEGCRFVELAQWDPSLTVTALEASYIGNEEKVKNAFVFRVKYGKSLHLGKERVKKLNALNTFPLVSPYSDTSDIDPDSLNGQKYRVCLIHEFVSLTLEKKASIHHLAEFKDEFRLAKDTCQLLKEQHRTFYLAGTEMNWTVFLKDAYIGEHLIEKDPLSPRIIAAENTNENTNGRH
ncbi:hypothetical protein SUGI_0179510 [Cryptomeria japonica]|nr:hypothetical protein SUGI_0179510 [Cryptomeria japonica]